MMRSTTFAARASVHQDNLFGVCHALGEAFGFNPFLLRVALAVAMMIRPEAVLIGYGLAGLLVLASRIIVRRPVRRQSARGSLTVAVPVASGEVLLLAA